MQSLVSASGIRRAVDLWLLPVFLSAVVIAQCAILSGKHLLWSDELLIWYPASASFGSMLRSTLDTVNAAPPVYFVFIWSWAALFGHSALSLRLFSATALVAAIFIMYFVLRRAYGALAAAVSLALVMANAELLGQSVQVRFHVFFFAEVAVAILLYQRMQARSRPPTRLLVVNAIVHASMAMTSYMAPFYSGAILSGILLTGLVRRRNPLRQCLSLIAGWIVFLPWLPVFARHRQIGRPFSWIRVPDGAELRWYYESYLGANFWLCAAGLAAFAIGGLVLAGIGPVRSRSPGRHVREGPLLMLLPALGLIPFLVYLCSTGAGVSPFFLPRYMLPCLLGWSILCAHAANRVFELGRRLAQPAPARALFAAQALAVVAFVGLSGWETVTGAIRADRKTPIDISSTISGDQPVVVERIDEFLNWHFYSPEASRLRFIVDPEVGFQDRGGGLLNHQIMAALKRQFPDRFKEVISTEEFLSTASTFWVKLGGTHWTPLRLGHNPDFVVEFRDGDFLRVRRRRLEEYLFFNP